MPEDARSLPTPIAIDGPAASGKSTLGQHLAEKLGYAFLDTGLMYRAFTLAALRRGVTPEDDKACAALARSLDLRVAASHDTRIFLDNEDVTTLLRGAEVEANVSAYSAIPGVREVMVARQREVAGRGPAVLAGRDIGTVVLPDAPLKFFLHAAPEIRAKRRSKQAAQEHHEAHRDITGRDVVDTGRATSPLRQARDAILIDTTHLTLDEMLRLAMEKVCAAA